MPYKEGIQYNARFFDFIVPLNAFGGLHNPILIGFYNPLMCDHAQR